MKDKIKEIIIGVEMTTIDAEEAVDKLFDLFGRPLAVTSICHFNYLRRIVSLGLVG
jgi:hypothetical protein